MTVKINTKDGQIELSDDVIATVVKVLLRIIFKRFCVKKTTQKVLLSNQQKVVFQSMFTL